MHDIWESAFVNNDLMWGGEPSKSALLIGEWFGENGIRDVLIPGIGYGRNATPFLQRKMSVRGIEISETAIEFARSRLGLTIPIHHGSVTEMPFDDRQYDGIFCHGLLYLLDEKGREKLLCDCFRHLAPGGLMAFSLISKTAPMYGKGERLGEDWFEILPEMKMYFYDEASARRDFDSYGLVDVVEVEEPAAKGTDFPFLVVMCERDK